MKLEKPLCPVCTMPAEGAVDIVPGVAYFEDSDDPSVREFSGYSNMWWEESQTKENEKGEVLLVCPNGHDWFSPAEYT
jgi:hypothetical protein